MIKTDKGFQFESTGRLMDIFDCKGFSIFEGVVGVGKDCVPEFFNEETKTYSSEFMDEEKVELSLYMIEQWAAFGRKKSEDLLDSKL